MNGADRPWQSLLDGDAEAVRLVGNALSVPDSHPPGLVFPGAFDPLHVGHLRMAQLAVSRTGRPVEFELSVRNVDKPGIDAVEIARRVGQFDRTHVVWLTRASTFVEKSALFPGATFVVGADTILRVAHPSYYQGDRGLRDQSLAAIAQAGCRFLVFGRLLPTGFQTLPCLGLPQPLAELCDHVDAASFRMDVSSTQLRQVRQVRQGTDRRR